MCVWNIMKRPNITKMITNRVRQFLEKKCLLTKLEKWKVKRLEDHQDYADFKEKKWNSFGDLFRVRLRLLHNNADYSNVTLICKSDGKRFENCHIEVLVCRLMFFLNLIRHNFSEREDLLTKREIVIEQYSSSAIELLIEYAYLGSVTSSTLAPLFELIGFQDQWFEVGDFAALIWKDIKTLWSSLKGKTLKKDLISTMEYLGDKKKKVMNLVCQTMKFLSEKEWHELEELSEKQMAKRRSKEKISMLEAIAVKNKEVIKLLKREKRQSEQRISTLEASMMKCEERLMHVEKI